jgi:hypothetical protein
MKILCRARIAGVPKGKSGCFAGVGIASRQAKDCKEESARKQTSSEVLRRNNISTYTDMTIYPIAVMGTAISIVTDVLPCLL